MGNEKGYSKKKIFTILGLLFLLVTVIWISLTGFDNNKERLVFIALFFLFCVDEKSFLKNDVREGRQMA